MEEQMKKTILKSAKAFSGYFQNQLWQIQVMIIYGKLTFIRTFLQKIECKILTLTN